MSDPAKRWRPGPKPYRLKIKCENNLVEIHMSHHHTKESAVAKAQEYLGKRHGWSDGRITAARVVLEGSTVWSGEVSDED